MEYVRPWPNVQYSATHSLGRSVCYTDDKENQFQTIFPDYPIEFETEFNNKMLFEYLFKSIECVLSGLFPFGISAH